MHYAVPYVLKLLAETEEGIECLAGFEAVSYAGAAVPDDLGDRLTERGVNLVSFYGTTGEYIAVLFLSLIAYNQKLEG